MQVRVYLSLFLTLIIISGIDVSLQLRHRSKYNSQRGQQCGQEDQDNPDDQGQYKRDHQEDKYKPDDQGQNKHHRQDQDKPGNQGQYKHHQQQHQDNPDNKGQYKRSQQQGGQRCKNLGNLSETEYQVTRANTNFALNFYKQVASCPKRGQNGNVFFSPLSISTAFSMLSLGARSNTHEQIMEGLRFNQSHMTDQEIHQAFQHVIQELNKKNSDLQVSIGNALFVEEKMRIQKSFEDDVTRYYQGKIKRLNFKNQGESEKQINDFVSDKTNGKIKEIVKDLDANTMMVLVNYVLYKGEWENAFDPSLTQEGDFTVDESKKVRVPMMNRIGRYNTYRDKDLQSQVIVLPYKNDTSMLIVVPEIGTFQKVEDALSEDTISNWLESSASSFVNLYMPKFTISGGLDLKDALRQMGMVDLFSDNADFSGLSDQGKLKISKVSHKAVLAVNECGTEAAGTASVEGIPMAMFPSFRIDRPFLAIIFSDAVTSILFMGKIVDPTEQ